MANGAPFEFTQDEFDFIGSDLSAFHVGGAAAASSAFPFLLSPVSLRSYPPAPGFEIPRDVSRALETREINPSRYNWARQRLDLMAGKDDKDKKWVHLLDGGLADNIGLRSILRAYDRSGGFIAQRINAGHIKRLIVIAVNARTDPPEPAGAIGRARRRLHEDRDREHGKPQRRYARLCDQSPERARAGGDERGLCNQRLIGCGAQPLPSFAQDLWTCFVEISFEGLPSPAREEFLNLPTTFSLPEESLKKLIGVAGTLLDDSSSFQKLLRALRGETRPGAGVGESGNCS